MSIERTERVRQIIIGRYADWIKRFDVSEYVQNPPMIEKLYEEKQLALVTSADLESQVKDLELRLHKLELENQGLRLRIDEVNKKSYFVFPFVISYHTRWDWSKYRNIIT